MSTVAPEQLFTADKPCPVCGGHEDMTRGQGERCFGFFSADGKYAYCTREEYAEGIVPSKSGKYPHRLSGTCKCGTVHNSATIATKPATVTRTSANGQRAHQGGAYRPLPWLAKYTGLSTEFLKTQDLDFSNAKQVRLRFRGSEAVKYRPMPTNKEPNPDKYRWEQNGASRPPFWPVPPEELPETVYLTPSETDCLCGRAAGLEAYALTKGEASLPPVEVFKEMQRRGASEILYLPHCDDAGKRAIAALERLLEGVPDLSLRVLDLREQLDFLSGEKDLRDLSRRVGVERLSELIGSVPTYTERSLELTPGLAGVSGADLMQRAEKVKELDYLSMLGEDGFFVVGWSHLLSGYSRVGKTDLLFACTNWSDWSDSRRILWVTEESERLWEQRIKHWRTDCSHITFVFALGMDPAALLQRALQGPEPVVILDTTKLLKVPDEGDNAAIERVYSPWVAGCRRKNKTLIVNHHNRKGGGQHGEGISGGHAWMALTDIPIEVLYDPSHKANRRLVRTYSRLIEPQEGTYEKVGDGDFQYLGAYAAVTEDEVSVRVKDLLSDQWQTSKEVHEALAEPKPSDEQVRKVLNALAKSKEVLRDPPIEKGSARGTKHSWKLPR